MAGSVEEPISHSSDRTDWVKPTTPRFAAEWALKYGAPRWATMEDTWITTPSPCSFCSFICRSVTGHGHRLPAQPLDLGTKLLERRPVPCEQAETRAQAGKVQRGAPPDPGRRSGDDHDLLIDGFHARRSMQGSRQGSSVGLAFRRRLARARIVGRSPAGGGTEVA